MSKIWRKWGVVLGLAIAIGLFDMAGAAVPTETTKVSVSGRQMRSERRAGVGFVGGGLSGIAGINLEINLTDHLGLMAGFGTSTDFQTLFMGFKHVLGGTWFLPYASWGYARWFANGESRQVGTTTPGFVGERLLSENERRQGRFSENLIFGGLGLQYLELKGDWAGVSLYVEGLLLADIKDAVVAPTGGLGLMYYF